MELLRDDEEDQELDFVVNGIPRAFFERMDYFNSFDEDIFYKRFRMSKNTCLFVLNLIEIDIEHPYDFNNSFSPINQLLVFLRVCATGSHLTLVADFAGMHYSTISRIMKRVGTAIARKKNDLIKMPHNQEKRDIQNLIFYEKARFPRVVGVIDCTHIRIQSPGGEDAEIYRNRKGYFSINTQIISDGDLKITDIVARWPGSSHDSTIFNNSQVKQAFDQNEFPNCLLLGDSWYFQRPYLMTPLLDPQNIGQMLYNEAHIRTRNLIERVNGILKRRFPILAYGCRLKVNTVLVLIVALAIQHNICREQNERDPPEPEDLERFLMRMQEDAVPNIPPAGQAADVQADLIREQIINYFSNLN